MISVAAVSLSWDVSGMALATLVVHGPGLTARSTSVRILKWSLFRFFSCGYHHSEGFSIACASKKDSCEEGETIREVELMVLASVVLTYGRVCAPVSAHGCSFLLPVSETAE